MRPGRGPSLPSQVGFTRLGHQELNSGTPEFRWGGPRAHPNSGVPEFGTLNVQLGYSRVGGSGVGGAASPQFCSSRSAVTPPRSCSARVWPSPFREGEPSGGAAASLSTLQRYSAPAARLPSTRVQFQSPDISSCTALNAAIVRATAESINVTVRDETKLGLRPRPKIDAACRKRRSPFMGGAGGMRDVDHQDIGLDL